MNVKLESLIEKIKKDGLEEAQKVSNEIIEKAKLEAKEIIEKAKKQAKEIEDKASANSAKLKSNTENSLRQAARDLTLSLKEQISKLFDSVLEKKISQELNPECLKNMILLIVEKWSLKESETLEVLISKDEQKKVVELVVKEIKKQAKEQIELKVSKDISKGFRIGIKGDSAYYDFTKESILESLKVFLNPMVSSMLAQK